MCDEVDTWAREADVSEEMVASAVSGYEIATAACQPAVDKNDRRTPRWFFLQVVARYGPFTLDIAASKENTLCTKWLGPGSPWSEDALQANWLDLHGNPAVFWGNIPYGPPGTIDRFIDHAQLQRDRFGVRGVLLLPADVSTKWYQEMQRTELVENVPFRLAFEAPHDQAKNGAKFGSCLVYIAPKLSNAAPTRQRRKP